MLTLDDVEIKLAVTCSPQLTLEAAITRLASCQFNKKKKKSAYIKASLHVRSSINKSGSWRRASFQTDWCTEQQTAMENSSNRAHD